MAVCNTVLLRQLVISKKRFNSNSNKNKSNITRATTITVIILTSSFMITTLPSSLATAFYLTELYSSPSGTLLLYFFDCISFTYHACSSLILLISNRSFRNELYSILKITRTLGTKSQVTTNQTSAVFSLRKL